MVDDARDHRAPRGRPDPAPPRRRGSFAPASRPRRDRRARGARARRRRARSAPRPTVGRHHRARGLVESGSRVDSHHRSPRAALRAEGGGRGLRRRSPRRTRRQRSGRAAGGFTRAAEFDPAMAEAAVYLVAYSAFGGVSETRLRALYQRAFNLRDKLVERDRAFLLALEPKVMRSPPDLVDAAKRFADLTRAYPSDAELHDFAAYFHSLRGDDAAALTLATKAVDLDAEYGDAHRTQARLLARLGRRDEALASLARCTAAAPGSADCHADRARLFEVAGDCKGAEEAARNRLKWAPGHRGAARDPGGGRRRAAPGEGRGRAGPRGQVERRGRGAAALREGARRGAARGHRRGLRQGAQPRPRGRAPRRHGQQRDEPPVPAADGDRHRSRARSR